MEEIKYRGQEEVNRIKKKRYNEISASFAEHVLTPDSAHQVALLRGHVITMATQLEEMIEVITEFYYLRGPVGRHNESFRLSYFGPDKGLKMKVENMIMIIKTSRPIFGESCKPLIKELNDFPSMRNIFAHHYSHKSNQGENEIVLHCIRRDENELKIRTSTYELKKHVTEIYEKWLPLRHMMQQFLELLLNENDIPLDRSIIDTIKIPENFEEE